MEVSILQWNVWYQEDILNIMQFLKRHSADIICLQELTLGAPNQTIKDTPRYVAEQLGYNYYHKELPIESTDGTKMELANGIFSHFPIESQRYSWINEPEGSGGYSDEYRAYVEVKIRINDMLLSVGTTHMSYTDRFTETASKHKETDHLTRAIASKSQNYILAGDLNAQPNAYTVDQISRYLTHAGPDFNQKTWTTKPFSYRGFKATKLDWRLNYIFTSPNLQVNSAEILPTPYSDHLPVLAKVWLD